ncbi:FadR/GntR family transcriptional regulator [Labedella endophytica]|uniref:FadR family transcriptional regulator n=1 Tax=Labedella endophytica TaxID=1523160 RepID=A0A3S0VSB1_9MICO|nr:FadR/GntR family transcriptional regulator [Labedella endophytica]RUQ99169.1 FadR family transcriptional regulator [Labedella endophytica]
MMSSLHDRVLHDLGLRIVSGDIVSGSTMRAEALSERYDVSRSVVREVLRVLESLGLVRSVRRVGIRVLPPGSWNLIDPLVIRWRLAGSGRGTQFRSLTELRGALEPTAAELAARHAPLDLASELLSLAARMRSVGREGRLEEFLVLDTEFHTLVLRASGNEMFAGLSGVIAEVLSGRTEQGLMPERPHDEALQLHVDVADAIQGGRPEAARAAMQKIMERTMREVESIWDGQERTFDARS